MIEGNEKIFFQCCLNFFKFEKEKILYKNESFMEPNMN